MSSGGNIVWLGLGLIGVAFIAPSFKSGPPAPPPAEARKPIASGQAAPSAGNGFASREIARAPDGHFYLDAQVNGAQVHFLVDTGASMVALTAADAQRAGIALPGEGATAEGAGGAVEIIPVTIDRVAAGRSRRETSMVRWRAISRSRCSARASSAGSEPSRSA